MPWIEDPTPMNVPTDTLLEHLRKGEPTDQVRRALGIEPAAYLMALGAAALGSETSGDWPTLVQGQPRLRWIRPYLDQASWGPLFPRASRPALLSVEAGLLQVHDFWEPSHEAAQEAGDLGERGFSAYWHGIAHRREPDAGNASYWFRRVGNHPIFPRLAREAGPIVEGTAAAGGALRPGLITEGSRWDPYVFIDICTSARAGSPQADAALKLQRLEMTLLLEATIAAL